MSDDKAFRLPNIRKLFTPILGNTIAEIDLAGADAQVVAWEAGDEKLKQTFKQGLQVHAVNARDIYGDVAGDGTRMPYYKLAKVGVHLTNYGGSARTCSGALGISEWEARQFQETWFRLHPEIPIWHSATQHLLSTKREVKNRFGYRRFYFDRIDRLLAEALAWVPQSTVACVCNQALVKMDEDAFMQESRVALLLQVHDSLVFEYPTYLEARILPYLHTLVQITIPYEDPLTIPWGLKTSTVSWGDCVKRDWPI